MTRSCICVKCQPQVFTWHTNHSRWPLDALLTNCIQCTSQACVILCALPRLYKSAGLCSWDWAVPELKQSPYTRSVVYSTASCLRAGLGWGRAGLRVGGLYGETLYASMSGLVRTRLCVHLRDRLVSLTCSHPALNPYYTHTYRDE